MRELPKATFAILGFGVVVTLGTGFFGWSKVYGPAPDRNFLDAFYHTILAFAGDDSFIAPIGTEQHNGWILTSRIFGLLTTFSAIASVVISVLGNRVLRWWSNFSDNHTVIIGASHFAIDLVKSKDRVVVFDTVEKLENLGPITREGQTILLPDLMVSPASIERALGNPSEIIFGDVDTITNVERARNWIAQTTAGVKKMKIRVENNAVARDLELLTKDFAKIKLISRSETAARSLVTSIAPTAMALMRGQDRVHFVLVGLGQTNLAIAEELALRCHHHKLQPLRLTILDKDVDRAQIRIRTERPDLLNKDFGQDGLKIDFVQVDALECSSDGFVPKLIKLEQEVPFTGVVVSAGDDSGNLAIAMRLRQLQVEKLCLKAPIFLRTESQNSAAAAKFDDLTGGVVPFGGRNLSSEDLELESLHEELAEDVHNRWRASPDVEKTEENKWKNLTTIERRSSFRAALSFVELFYEAGFQPPAGHSIAGMRIEGKAANAVLGHSALKTSLAKTEHDRWCAERRLEGYIKAPDGVRDNEKKHHHLLLTYDELVALNDPDQLNKDMENVEAAFNLGIAKHEAHPTRPCWRKTLSIGVLGPLAVDECATRDGIGNLFSDLQERVPDLESYALDILTPNAPGFDRVAALYLAQAWKKRTKRPCRLVLVNAARTNAMDKIALRHVGKDADDDAKKALLKGFADQSDALDGLASQGHAFQILDMRKPGVSDVMLMEDNKAYDASLSLVQTAILDQADWMIFDTNGGKARWTMTAKRAWERKQGKKTSLCMP